jgi:hypothetical protein
MKRRVPTIVLVLALLAPACTLHSSATRWNGVLGHEGHPVHVKSTTNIGVNLLVFIPFLGGTTIDRMIDSITADIAREKGDKIRLIETSAENYWYGFPPFTWVLTPVITTITADYLPAKDMLQKALDEEAARKRGS